MSIIAPMIALAAATALLATSASAAKTVDATLNGLSVSIDAYTGSILRMEYPGPGVMLESGVERGSAIDLAYPVKTMEALRLASRYSHGARSFSLNAIDRAGKRLWRVDVGEPVLSMALADLNGDGRAEICVGTEDGHVLAIDRQGEVVASWSTAGPIRKLATFPGSPARLAVACEDGRLALLKME